MKNETISTSPKMNKRGFLKTLGVGAAAVMGAPSRGFS